MGWNKTSPRWEKGPHGRELFSSIVYVLSVIISILIICCRSSTKPSHDLCLLVLSERMRINPINPGPPVSACNAAMQKYDWIRNQRSRYCNHCHWNYHKHSSMEVRPSQQQPIRMWSSFSRGEELDGASTGHPNTQRDRTKVWLRTK